MTDPFAPPGGSATPTVPLYGEPLTGTRPPGTAPRNGLGLAALVVGVLGLVGAVLVVPGVLLGTVATVLGLVGLRRVRTGAADNRGQALAGTLLGLLAAAASVAVVVAVLNTDAGRRWVDCVDAAPDQAAQTACNEAFARELVGQ